MHGFDHLMVSTNMYYGLLFKLKRNAENEGVNFKTAFYLNPSQNRRGIEEGNKRNS